MERKLLDYLRLLQQLDEAGCEFVIVGGVAAMLHGNTRVTFDLDVVPNLKGGSWKSAIERLWALGARPRIPESLSAICDTQNIHRWIEEKGMLALNMRSSDGSVEVDFLVSESNQFDLLRKHGERVTLEGRSFFVASIDDLISMKRKANRPQDILDIAQLETIRNNLKKP